MKIGFLHSIKLHLGNIANTKMYRIHYKEWENNPLEWTIYYYGQKTDRAKLRGLIYDYRPYYKEFQDFGDYSLIALSLNFDYYPSDFYRFVKEVINWLYEEYPILHQKEVIVMAGNEVQEKRGSAEKVFETCWDTKLGIEKSIKPDLPICFWNQGIGHSDTREAVKKLTNSSLMQSICKYFGYQSLGTTPERMKEYIPFVQSKGFEVIDVELGTLTDNIGDILNLFHINKNNGIDKVFFITPFISRELANYDKNFRNYALRINDNRKEKFSIINIIQHFKDKKEEILSKMLDNIAFSNITKMGCRGLNTKRIQYILNYWINRDFIEGLPLLITDGLFGAKTKEAVKRFQETCGVVADGIVGQITWRELTNYILLTG